jgi:hypothetical protein
MSHRADAGLQRLARRLWVMDARPDATLAAVGRWARTDSLQQVRCRVRVLEAESDMESKAGADARAQVFGGGMSTADAWQAALVARALVPTRPTEFPLSAALLSSALAAAASAARRRWRCGYSEGLSCAVAARHPAPHDALSAAHPLLDTALLVRRLRALHCALQRAVRVVVADAPADTATPSAGPDPGRTDDDQVLEGRSTRAAASEPRVLTGPWVRVQSARPSARSCRR